ncbi:MAG: TIGR03557 family F420-dependent LLM class oxidoreductase [Candidatus Dormibacteraeota bacterium]|nr:TIGR03557 family F420-dependent LLM class oxidoreductase [Candidatus Dormibacteraeota bacterium]
MQIGFFLSSEEFGPRELVAQARRAEEAGFQGLWISDHYHPWSHAQGNSPFVWSVIGALSQVTSLPVTTAVTCPTVRIHPAVIAQAAATSQVLLDGRFRFGVGSGEALNEHILGDVWPGSGVRQEMLEEAVEVIRKLFAGGVVNHRGRHYTVEHAELYTRHPTPPPIYVSGFGPRSVGLAARIGDGYCLVTPQPEMVERFRKSGGAGKPVQAGLKVCYGADAEAALATAHRIWANEELPGELAQVLPAPEHFEQASSLVTPEMVGETVPCGPDLEKHLEAIQRFADAGVDELYIQQIGGDHDAFFRAYEKEVLPRFGREAAPVSG